MFAYLRCLLGWHGLPLYDRLHGIAYYRCPICWKVRAR